jgi:hypothetical protein
MVHARGDVVRSPHFNMRLEFGLDLSLGFGEGG